MSASTKAMMSAVTPALRRRGRRGAGCGAGFFAAGAADFLSASVVVLSTGVATGAEAPLMTQ